MPVRIVWRGNRLDLKPVWVVDYVRIHTVTGYTLPDGSKQDTMVVYFHANEAQIRTLFDEYGRANIPHCILGLNVIPLIPGAVLWRYELPDYKIKEEYRSFEVHPILEGDTAPTPRPAT